MNKTIRRVWQTVRSILHGHGATGDAGGSPGVQHGDGAAGSPPEAEVRSDGAGGDPELADLSPAEFLVRTGATKSDYVLHLLQQNDGKISQGAICDRLGWSKATTSRKLGALEDDGRITRRRIGRKNVVFLAVPEAAPTDIEFEASGGAVGAEEAEEA